VVPEDWIRQATASMDIPAFPGMPPDAVRLGYGYQWWTIAGSKAYVALGLQGQFIYVDPATDTVVVKLSYFPPGDQAAEGEALAFLVAASHWTPN
jgi:CubicO group peptidase (beta-lactamase class C family)